MIWRWIIFFLIYGRVAFGLTFAWLSDTHLEIGRVGLQDTERRYSLSVELFRSAIEKINHDPQIEFVIITGDVINNGRAYNLDALSLELANLTKPCFLVVGNNDFGAPTSGFAISKQTFFAAFPECFVLPGKGYWSKLWRDFLLIGIDGVHPKNGGNYFTFKFLDWLRKEILRYRDKKIIFFSHYPPVDIQTLFSGRTRKNDSTQKDIFPVIAQANRIVGWFAGHYHQEIEKKLGRINLFVAYSLVQYPHVFYRVNIGENTIIIRQIPVASSSILAESKTLLEKYFEAHQLQKAIFEIKGGQQLAGIYHY